MKSTFKIKQLATLGLIFLLSINSFAVTMGDNDGSAFITKAEFDSLKNNFQSQIDSYNQGIDSKIDAAIAAYLVGTTISRDVTEFGNISILSYPLRVVDKYDVLTKLKSKAYTPSHQTPPIIEFGYDIYTVIMRTYESTYNATTGIWTTKSVRTMIDNMYFPAKTNLDYFLNGSWSKVDAAHPENNRFSVDGTTENVSVNLKSVVGCENLLDGSTYATNELWYAYVALDYKVAPETDGHSISGESRLKSRRAGCAQGTFYTDYENLKSIYSLSANTTGCLSENTDCFTNWTATANLDTWPAFTGSNWIILDNASTKMESWSSTKTYNPIIKSIYNHTINPGTTNYQNYIGAVSYGSTQEIYFTNNKENRQKLFKSAASGKKIVWLERDKSAIASKGDSKAVITEGLNIESAYSDSTKSAHAYNQKSTVETYKMYYNFEKDDGTKVEHKMIDGIPIFSVPDSYKDTIKNLDVEIDISSYDSSKASNKKYAIFSTKPISTYNYAADVSGILDYLLIDKINGTTVSTKKVELTEGTNTISLPKVKGGDVLYMKILWDDSSEDYITINKNPILRIHTDS